MRTFAIGLRAYLDNAGSSHLGVLHSVTSAKTPLAAADIPVQFFWGVFVCVCECVNLSFQLIRVNT